MLLATPGCAAPRHVEGRWDQSIHLGIGFNDRKKHLEVGKATMQSLFRDLVTIFLHMNFVDLG